jgi:hypothetical protein
VLLEQARGLLTDPTQSMLEFGAEPKPTQDGGAS